MIRLFLAALVPSLLAIIMLPTLALSGGRHELQQRQPQQAVADTIVIQDSGIARTEVQVRAGDLVRWENRSERDHEVAGDKKEFRSGTIKPGKGWNYLFEKPGAYRYHCALHPREKGIVRVEQ